MSSKSDTQHSKADTVKLVAAVALLVIAIAAFYYFSQFLTLVRVIGLLIAAGGAAAIVATTDLGRQLFGFFQDSRTELRKVVWPSRNETLQVSLTVVVLVLLVGVFLWLVDMFLFWVVRSLTG
jgi:preprotein translocase subunit SecE